MIYYQAGFERRYKKLAPQQRSRRWHALKQR